VPICLPYLFQIVSPIDEEDPSLGTVSFTQPTRFGTHAGVIGFKFAPVPGNAGEAAYRETCAAAVLPSGRVVAIKLQSRGDRDRKDTALVDQIARAITIGNEPELAPADKSITLAGGIEVKAPSAMRLVEKRDPHRTSRTLWYVAPESESESAAEARWASVELVPCLFASAEMLAKEQTDAASELRTMLVLREPHWREAKVKVKGESAGGQLQADMAGAPAGEMFLTRAYLQTSPSGQALLAIVRASSADIDSYWTQIQPTIKFNGTAQLTELVNAGRAEVTRGVVDLHLFETRPPHDRHQLAHGVFAQAPRLVFDRADDWRCAGDMFRVQRLQFIRPVMMLVAGESLYTDEVLVGGKATF